MSNNSEQQPLIEPWRVIVIILTVIGAMIYAHAITPTQAGAVKDRPAVLQTP